MLTPSTSQARTWRVTQGASRATIKAPDYFAARERAAAIGLKNPDSIVLQEDRKQ